VRKRGGAEQWEQGKGLLGLQWGKGKGLGRQWGKGEGLGLQWGKGEGLGLQWGKTRPTVGQGGGATAARSVVDLQWRQGGGVRLAVGARGRG
jgi:hypothetical protein